MNGLKGVTGHLAAHIVPVSGRTAREPVRRLRFARAGRQPVSLQQAGGCGWPRPAECGALALLAWRWIVRVPYQLPIKTGASCAKPDSLQGRRRVLGRGGGRGSSRHYTTAGTQQDSRGELPVAISANCRTRSNLCNSFGPLRSGRILNGLDIVEQVVDIIRLQLERRHIRMPHKNPLPKSLLKIPNRIPK